MEIADLVTLTEEILDGKLDFLCSVPSFLRPLVKSFQRIGVLVFSDFFHDVLGL